MNSHFYIKVNIYFLTPPYWQNFHHLLGANKINEINKKYKSGNVVIYLLHAERWKRQVMEESTEL